MVKRSMDDKQVLVSVLSEAVVEQRRARRWRIFFRLFIISYIVVISAFWMFKAKAKPISADIDHIGLVKINGMLAPNAQANAERINQGLTRAFSAEHVKAVILKINSPGGSPVVSDRVYNQIRYLRKIHPKIKLYVVCEDVCASGGYYIASAADDIYVDPASIVGGIGVISPSFDLTGLIQKIGVKRRLFTSGRFKGVGDPFSPMSPRERESVQKRMDSIHQLFIEKVKEGRGQRLKKTTTLFAGEVWTGQQAEKLGLIDGFGSVDSVARDVVGVKKVVNYTIRPNWAELFAMRFGRGAVETLSSWVANIQ